MQYYTLQKKVKHFLNNNMKEKWIVYMFKHAQAEKKTK